MPPTLSPAYALNFDALGDIPLQRLPYEHLVVPDILNPAFKNAIASDCPETAHSGSFPLETLTYGKHFQMLVDEMLGNDFARRVGEKFDLDLRAYRTIMTFRGQSDWGSDGKIHTDSRDKVLSILLYLNAEWRHEGGRLRLLRSKNLEDYAVEVPPTLGTMLIFRRGDASWHGHKPYQGRRLVLQMNWVSSERYRTVQAWRHRCSAWFKGLKSQKEPITHLS